MKVGAIAPGRLAHVLVTTSLEQPTPRLVFAKGGLVAEEGRLLTDAYQQVDPVVGSRPFWITDIHPDLFRIAERPGFATVPVITIVNRTVTGAEEIALPVRNGFYVHVPPENVLPAFLITRDGRKTGRGFVSRDSRADWADLPPPSPTIPTGSLGCVTYEEERLSFKIRVRPYTALQVRRYPWSGLCLPFPFL